MCPGRNDASLAASWRSSAAIAGSSGTDDAIPLADWAAARGVVALLSDSDRDGNAALIEYPAGTDPAAPGGSPLTAEMSADGELRLEVRQRIGADEVEIAAERSGALMAWGARGRRILGARQQR